MINDGQHRRAAIEKALGENPELSKRYSCSSFFQRQGIKKISTNVFRF